MTFGDDEGRAQAAAWAAQQLAQCGFGPPKQITVHHQRPWSLVLRISTAEGNGYLKAVRPGFEHEIRVTALLAARWPEFVPQVIAADEERGWMLLEDGGPTLRSAAADSEIVNHWRQLLPIYAHLQQELADAPARLLAEGVPDRRPAALAEQLRGMSDDPMIITERLPSGLAPAERLAWADLITRLPDLCAELDGAGVPSSLNHGDLHDGNVFLRAGHYRIFDWGDCSLSHPFFSLRTVFVSLENRLGWDEYDPRFEALGEQYLQAWTGIIEGARLHHAYRLAVRLWAAGSLLSWRDGLRALSPAERQPYEHVLPSLARELIEAVGRPV